MEHGEGRSYKHGAPTGAWIKLAGGRYYKRGASNGALGLRGCSLTGQRCLDHASWGVNLTRLIVLRHGETLWNLEGKLQGQMDSPLTPLGVAQSQALAERLSRCQFSALYSSDLDRARQTAALIAERTGHEVLFHIGLRERHLGVFQGLTWPEVEQQYPQDFARFMSGELDYVPPEGESFNESSIRIMACLEELGRRHSGQQLVAVSHGGVLGAVLRRVLGVSPEIGRHFKRFNGSWNVFTFENGVWFLETWGDVSHLQQTRSLDDV